MLFKHTASKPPLFLLNSGLSVNLQRQLAAVCSFYILFSICIGTPLSLFVNSPRDFFIPFSNILFVLLIFFGSLSGVAIAVIWFIPEKLHRFFCFLSGYAAIVVFLYTNLIVPDYGLLDNFEFIFPGSLERTLSQVYIEMLALITLLTLCYRFFYKLSKFLLVAAILMSLSSITVACIHVYKGISCDEIFFSDSKKSTPSHRLAFSPDKKNVLILLLDGFSGALVPEFIENGSLDGFKDFTWYRNTLSTNGGTWGSISGVVGGHKYTIKQVNNQPDVHVEQMLSEAYSVLPSAFNAKGYDVTVINPMFGARPNKGNALVIQTEQEIDALLLKEGKSESSVYKQILMLSLFRTAPMFLKNIIYSRGDWHIYPQMSPFVFGRKMSHWNLLNNFSALPLRMQDSPTFTFAHILVPHSPQIIDGKLKISKKNGTYKNEARKALLLLSKLFRKMKSHGVFDNTVIAVVSDHGWWVNNDLFEKTFNDKMEDIYELRASAGMVHALLLVKEAGETNEALLTSDKFLSNADLPSIVCTVIGGCKDVMGDARTLTDGRQLFYSVFRPTSVGWLDSTSGFSEELIKSQFIVKESIFDEDNWTQIK
ncbi:MAG: hypothetical protein ACI8PB_002586 [Desulforhopalus sp.]|jgi:hypothetical protein